MIYGELVCGRRAIQIVACNILISLSFIVYSQETAPTPSLGDLENQLNQKQLEKKAADDARAAKAAKAAQQARVAAMRAAEQARVDAIKAAAQHLTGRWVGNITLTNEPLYWCKVETTYMFTLDLGSLDAATSKMSGYLTQESRFTSSYYGKTYDGRSASVNKRIESCQSKYNGNKVDHESVYLHFDATSTSQRIDYIEESCTGSDCPQQLDRGSFGMTMLDNGQAELSVGPGKVRVSRN